jgi:hydroxymethylpyrimidine pyrophosphatase-like HAD family hydrolase
MTSVRGSGADAGPPVFDAAMTWHLDAGPELLVALDIDGTILARDQSLAPAVRDAVRALVATGTHVVLATGRSLPAVLPVLDGLGLSRGWVVASNGAACVRLDPALPVGYEFTDVVMFDPEPVLRLLRAEVPEAVFAVERLGRGFAVTRPFPDGELIEDVEVVDFEDLCAAPVIRVTVRAPDLTAEDFHEIVERCGIQGVTYAVGWTAWLDLTPPGVSKASALEMLRERLEVPVGATVATGDGRNDIDMLRWAGLGVAMGGSDDVTLAAADARTGSVAEHGVVPVLRSFLR